jgi:5-methyltetrahydrofolate--homocysteine methyltransferase
VLLCDGAEGTRIQAQGLDTERDFLGHENCSKILNESRPDLVRDIHYGYLVAGADAIQTNSFGGSPITLVEFGIAEKACSLNRRAAELAQEALAMFAGDGPDTSSGAASVPLRRHGCRLRAEASSASATFGSGDIKCVRNR